MSDINQRYAEYLRSELSSYPTYHNHTAFYLPGILGLAYLLAGLAGVKWGIMGDMMFSLLLLIAAMLVLFFVSMQFEMRSEAADIQRALRLAMARVCGNTEPLQQADLEVEEKKQWPRFVQSKIDELILPRTLRVYLTVLWDFVRLRWTKPARRLRTEIASYLAIILTTMVAIFVIWK